MLPLKTLAFPSYIPPYLILSLSYTVRGRSSHKAGNIEWIKPVTGDTFGPGDNIVGEWTSNDAIVSPSVSLCVVQGLDGGDDDNDDGGDGGRGCGAMVWPKVEQDGETYSFSLIVPDLSSSSNYYLRMKDDFGNMEESPGFSLDPSSKSSDPSGTVSGESVSQDVANGYDSTSSDSSGSESGPSSSSGSVSGGSDEHSSQTPFNDSSGDESADPGISPKGSSGPDNKRPDSSIDSGSGTSSHSSPPSAAPGLAPQDAPGRPKTAHAITTAGSPNGAPSPSYPTDVNAKVDTVPPQIANSSLSRAGLPTAAVAVPISLVGATLVASLALCIIHRRSLDKQRARNAHLLSMQRNGSVKSVWSEKSKVLSFASSGLKGVAKSGDPDIEKAIDALYGYSDNFDLRRHNSVAYAPVERRRPSLRQDVRRERTRAYNRSYERSFDRRTSRTRSDYYTRLPSPRIRHHRPRSPLSGYAPSLLGHPSRNNSIRGRNYDDEDDELEGSTTDSILSGYLSPAMPGSRLSRYDPYCARPQSPPRSHSRNTAPDMMGWDHRRWYEGYEGSPRARSHRSF